MLPSAFHLRRLLAVCLLFLLLPFCACAEEDALPAHVYIAMNGTEQLPLARMLAYRAERQGAQVSLYEFSDKAPFYTSESGVSIGQCKSNFSSDPLPLRIFLKNFFNQEKLLDIPSSGIDIYILSRYSRESTIIPKKPDKDGFNNALNGAYDAIQSKMDAFPHIRLHFYFLSDNQSKENPDALDNRLKDAFGDRVSSQTTDYKDPAQLLLSMFSSSSDSLGQRLLKGTLPQDGCIAYDRKGTSEWLMLTFPQGTAMDDVQLFADEQPDAPLPSLYDAASNAYWLYLPEGTESRTFTINCQRAGEASDTDSYALQIWAKLPAFNVALYDAQDQRFDPNMPSDQPAADSTESTDQPVVDSPESADQPAADSAESADQPVVDSTESAGQPAADSAESADQPAADSAESADQPAADSAESADQPAASSPGKIELFSEASSWTLELNCPGFNFTDLAAVLKLDTGDDKETLECTEISEEGGTLIWAFDLPAMAPETTGTLTLEYHLWNELHCSFSWDFSVQNRAPTLLKGDASDPLPVYIDIPLGEAKQSYAFPFDLTAYFKESDAVDSLTFSTSFDRQSSYTAEIQDGRLLYTPHYGAGTFSVDVTACDQHGSAVVFRFNFEHRSMLTILDSLHLKPEENNVFSMPILSENSLRFRLCGETENLKEMQQALGLPPLEECLEITINDTSCQIAEENGDFIVSYTIPSSNTATLEPIPLNLNACFSYTPPDSTAFPLSIQLELPNILKTQLSYAYSNDRPTLKSEFNVEHDCTRAIDGLPGRYEPVSFAELFHGGQPLQLSSLFENRETLEPLTYTIQVNSGRITIQSSSNPPVILDAAGTNSRIFDATDAALPLDLSLDTPGEYSFEIYATDSEEQSSESAVYSVKLYSSFIRLVLIVVISITILLALIAVALTVRYLLKPSFKGMRIRICYLRGEQAPSRRTAQHMDQHMDTWLSLDPYHKDSVSLMALLTASGHLPPQTCPPDVLMHIALAPGKHDALWVTCGAAVKSSSVEICIDNQKQESIRRFALPHRKTLKICFRKDGKVDTFLLYAERKSA